MAIVNKFARLFGNMERAETITVRSFLTGALVVVPLIWAGPQFLIGSIVNMLLCLAAENSQGKSLVFKAALPSLAVIARGALFGTFTPFLLYLWPIITVGNWVFMKVGRKNLLLAAIIKTSILAAGATLLFQWKIVPLAIVNSMGAIQLITALVGGSMAILWKKTKLY